ncbi:MAG: hypothetical protein CMJ81_19925 [Planctomycetaceae bacterium]|nr:hypothetical protein [Planctomycetaceae bacterium]
MWEHRAWRPTRLVDFCLSINLLEERETVGGGWELVVKTPPVELPFMNLRQFNPQSVVTPKPPDEFRIVVVGGSVVYGCPYDDRVSFPRLLEVGLRAAEPAVRWRVINMGAPGWGSTRLRSIADELQRLQADVAVVVSGNNEAIEAAFAREVFADREGRVRSLSWVTRHSHVMSLLVSVFGRIRASGKLKTDSLGRAELELSALVAARPELIDIYVRNLRDLTEKFKQAGANVVLGTVPVNLRTCPPLMRDAPGEKFGPVDQQVVATYRRAALLANQDENSAALEILSELVRRCSTSARVRFLYARCLEGAGRPEAAQKAYGKALELDSSMMRAFGALNLRVEQLASEQGVVLADFVRGLAAHSEHQVPGDDMFLDNCHLTRVGSALIAELLAETLVSSSLVAMESPWKPKFHTAVEDYLRELKVPLNLRIEALKFLMFYYRSMNVDDRRAWNVQSKIQILDPRFQHATRKFREHFFLRTSPTAVGESLAEPVSGAAGQ